MNLMQIGMLIGLQKTAMPCIKLLQTILQQMGLLQTALQQIGLPQTILQYTGLQHISLWQMSLSGAVLIAIVALIRAVGKNRLPKATFLILWYIALFRLLLPMAFSSPFSVYSLVAGNLPAIDVFGEETADAPLNDTDGIVPAQPDTTENSIPQPISQGNRLSIPRLFILWAVGAAVMAVIFVVRYFRCRREFQTALPVHNDFTTLWLREHPLRRTMEIRQLTGLSTPLAYGIFHPIILTPRNMDWEDKRQARYILFHEYIHIRRFDAVGKLMASAALCIHWFNPLVWLLILLFNRDMELSCDELVIRHFGERSRKAYAMTLLRMEEQRSNPAPLGSYFSKNATEERIKAMMKSKKKTVFALICSVTVVILGALAVFAMTPRAANMDNKVWEKLLRGETSFLYASENAVESKRIEDVPALFDPDDTYMKIWDFAVVDLDRDGYDEVILMVLGAAGDTGGFLILHQAGNNIYGYAVNSRILNALKSDGTFHYSAPIQDNEAGIASITAFSDSGYTMDKISYFLGNHMGWDTCVVNHQPATEEELSAAFDAQDNKQDAAWYDFTAENIASLFDAQE